jgi:hypothetical protein
VEVKLASQYGHMVAKACQQACTSPPSPPENRPLERMHTSPRGGLLLGSYPSCIGCKKQTKL